MSKYDVDELFNGIINRDRSQLARAITLIESEKGEHFEKAHELLERILPLTGNAQRIGISGTPGVGKSTFINKWGLELASLEPVAVLTIDPSSHLSGGSILGDKTRMIELSQSVNAFIRPSPSKGKLGGVSHHTREVILLCEAFGFKKILIESVGVGQSEIDLSLMVDFFIMLLQPASGDDLQGIKRGILEVVDLVIVHKADLHPQEAREASHHYTESLHVLRQGDAWTPMVMSLSSLANDGWEKLREIHHRFFMQNSWKEKRREQKMAWFKDLAQDKILIKLNHYLESPEGERLLLKIKEDKQTIFQALKEFSL